MRTLQVCCMQSHCICLHCRCVAFAEVKLKTCSAQLCQCEVVIVKASKCAKCRAIHVCGTVLSSGHTSIKAHLP